MKKLFSIFATFAMLCAVGCEEQGGGDDIDPNDKTEQPDDAYISINKDILTFSPDGESVDVNVYSNYEWTLTNNCDWVTTSVSGGEASEGGTTITLSADLTYDDREGTIIFSCGKAKKLLVVSQSFKEAIIADENDVFNVPAEGGNVIINYQTSVECEVIIPEEAKSWISLAPATRALVSESATLTVAENTTYSERSAVVKVVKVGDNTLFAEYTINQVQNDAIIADNNTFNIKGLAQSINIAYKTYVECEVIIPEEAQSWITLAPATRALVDGSATLNIAENNTGAERSAVVKVVAANNKELFAEYTITQNQRYFMEYTSKDGYTVSPYDSSAFDATIIRNEYIDGKGYIEFDAPVTSIGYQAFEDCSSLTSITIPDSVIEIGKYAFRSCTSLTSITIPDSVTSIGTSAFSGCKSLTSVTIGNGVTSIGSYAFAGCTSLTSVTIPDSVTEIGIGAFYYCPSLKSVTIPDSVNSIGAIAFVRCPSLTSFQGKFASEDGRCLIVKGVLNSFAPAGLTEYSIPDSVTWIGVEAFYNCSSLTSITIPDSVTSIGDSAFSDCSSLTSITIPDSVSSIGSSAFSGCTGELIINSKIVEENYPSEHYPQKYGGWLSGAMFTKLTIGDSVTSIGSYAFADCTSLKSVTIGNGVTSIGKDAFYCCTSLTSVYCKPTTPPTGGYYMFGSNASGLKIYVPTASVEAYKAASYWSYYKSYIYGYDF